MSSFYTFVLTFAGQDTPRGTLAADLRADRAAGCLPLQATSYELIADHLQTHHVVSDWALAALGATYRTYKESTRMNAQLKANQEAFFRGANVYSLNGMIDSSLRTLQEAPRSLAGIVDAHRRVVKYVPQPTRRPEDALLPAHHPHAWTNALHAADHAAGTRNAQTDLTQLLTRTTAAREQIAKVVRTAKAARGLPARYLTDADNPQGADPMITRLQELEYSLYHGGQALDATVQRVQLEVAGGGFAGMTFQGWDPATQVHLSETAPAPPADPAPWYADLSGYQQAQAQLNEGDA